MWNLISHFTFCSLRFKKKKKNEQSHYEVNEAARWLRYNFVVKKINLGRDIHVDLLWSVKPPQNLHANSTPRTRVFQLCLQHQSAHSWRAGGTVVRVCVCARCFVWLSPSHARHHQGLLQEYLTPFRHLMLFISMSVNWMLWFIGRKQSCYPAECVREEKPGKSSCHRKWPRVEKRITVCYRDDPSSSPEILNLGFWRASLILMGF